MPKFQLFYYLAKKPILLLGIVPLVPVANTVDFYSIIKILTYLFVIDLITGICASYFEWKKVPEKKDKWFFGKGEGFSSNKFKQCGIKLLIYILAPLVLKEFQESFKIKNFTYDLITTAEIDITTAIIFIFCLNELYSIFHENLPKCGFNIYENLKKILSFYKKAKNKISI